MSETRFTPEPWRADCCSRIIGPDSRIVAVVGGGGESLENRAANCHLIEATPQLYRELEMILMEVDPGGPDCPAYPDGWRALAKARGEGTE